MDRRKSINILNVGILVAIVTIGIVLILQGCAIKNINYALEPRISQLSMAMLEDSIAKVLPKLGCRKERVRPYAIALAQACSYYKIDWKWRAAQITQESSWNPEAKSFIDTKLKGDKEREYAYGLSQIKPNTGKDIAEDLGEEYNFYKLLDGVTSIRWGTYYLSRRSVKHGHDISLTLRAYGAGDRGMKQVSTDNYYNRVAKFYKLINKELS